jgi:uncharacterized membrane protein
MAEPEETPAEAPLMEEPSKQETPAPQPAVIQSVPPQEPRQTYISIIKSSPFYADCSKIFHWRDPIKSGLLFGIFNFFYLLITWGEYTVITLMSDLLLALLAVCFGFVNYVVLKARWIDGKNVPNPFKARFKSSTFHVSRSTLIQHVDTVLDFTNLTIDLFRDVFYCVNPIFTAQAAGILYVTATIGNWFSAATLMWLVLLGFFIWPRLYEEKQQEIDTYWGIAKREANVYIQLGLSKLPPAVTSKLAALKLKTQ